MTKLNGIRATGRQKFSTAAVNGSPIEITLMFYPSAQGWFFNMSYEDFEVNGMRVTNNPNILAQYSNIIPFGMACAVTDGGEPFLVNDFQSERALLYILTKEELEAMQELAELAR